MVMQNMCFIINSPYVIGMLLSNLLIVGIGPYNKDSRFLFVTCIIIQNITSIEM